MKLIVTIVVMLGMYAGIGGPASAANDDLPTTFGECLLQAGDIRLVEDHLTCRLIRAYDFRIYGSGTSECGEEIMLEIWGETREGVVTFFFKPDQTIELPVLGEDDMVLPDEALPCRESAP